MAHGNDGGGSLRIPAAWSGCFTVKPSRGRIPYGPVYTESWNGFAAEGTITRSVRDCAAMLDATMGDTIGRRYTCPQPERSYLEETQHECRPLRIAVMEKTHDGQAFDPEHLEAVHQSARLLADLGHHIEYAAPSINIDALSVELYKTVAVDTLKVLNGIGAARGEPVRDDEIETLVKTFRDAGRDVTALEYANVNDLSMEAAHSFDSFMHQRYDLVMSPTMPVKPLKLGEIFNNDDSYDAFRADQNRCLNLTQVQNVTGQPAMSVPLHWSSDNLPIGIMFVAQYGDESTLFSLAAQLEKARPWWDKKPEGIL